MTTTTTTRPTTFQFDAYEVALLLVKELAGLATEIGRRDGDLAKQLRRAAASTTLNIAEGLRRNGGDRIHLWRVAAGSNSEVLAALDVATACGYVDAAAVAAAIGYQDRVGAMLYRLTH